MKHVANVLLLGVVLLGIAMMTDTPWGLGVALAPFVVWGGRFLLLVHRSIWASIVFWAGVAYFSWQAALVVLLSFLAVQMVKVVRQEGVRGRKHRRKKDDLHLYLDSRSTGGLGIGPMGDGGFQDSYDYDQRCHIGMSED
ncbi:permease [Salmonella enterica subsp. enterica serovar Kentucky]|uniref:Permease n=1 Tax=Aeromonas simiae TaxID=218936 RepID=A0A5J6X2L4_9GAMM|nr:MULTISPECIES: permease [Gammaproteobacteria]EAR6227611.1 permease [Salmonella enterica]EAR9557360.1 permease [Salmonella enterica subsp. enterica serovar Cerro]ECC0423042.1 permease [Salmonella enterica subsp. enterica serovar Kentucky]ECG9831061.1 permease [Salmonella enterica subsp. enterica serovar Montevideo]EFN3857958.1 permease [Escherichia coli]EJQ7543344.1 permease [Salmonella enterica subsp. enterica]